MPELDPSTETATLVADVLAWLDAWQRDGGVGLPTGPLDGLGAAPVWPSVSTQRPAAAHVAESPNRIGAAPEHPPAPLAAREGASGRPGFAAERGPAPRTAAAAPQAREEHAPAAASAPRPGLFGGRWAAARETPADRLAKVLPSGTCADCGRSAPRGQGPPDAQLAVLAAPLAGEARQMFERMLLHVLAMEPRDVFLLDPVACATCAAQLRLQLETVAPRAVLAMGEAARALTQGQVGAWGSFAGAPCLATLHPEELLADPGAKRAAFEHLKELARRVRA